MKWIEQNKDHPFFLYLAHFAVHDPIQGRGDLVLKYEKELYHMQRARGEPYILEANPDDSNRLSPEALEGLLRDEHYQEFSLLPDRTVKIKQHQDNPEYAAMVESVDESLGRVLAKLKELKLDNNTIVIFFSDNGGMSAANFGNPNRIISKSALNKAYSTSNLPLRGGKGWLYEGGIREPLIIYWPNGGKCGTGCDVPVIGTDFYATVLDMLGVHPAESGQNGMDGMSLVSLLKGDKEGTEKIAKRAIYWHWPHYSNHGAQSPGGAIRYQDYKLIEYFENDVVQLFNLKIDPGEQHDLASAEPEKAQQLRAMLHAWRNDVNADMPPPNPDYDPNAHWPAGQTEDEP